MKITVIAKGNGIRVFFHSRLVGEAFCQPEDKWDLGLGVCVAMLKAKPSEDCSDKFAYPWFWREFELDDPYLELVIEARSAYDKEMASRRAKKGKVSPSRLLGAYFGDGTRIEINDDPVIGSNILYRHAVALKQRLDREVEWQKILLQEL